MQPDEIRATGEVARDAFGGVVGVVERVHKAIASRSFRSAGPQARLARAMHDEISDGVYAGVRGIGKTVPKGAAQLLAGITPEQSPSLASRPAGSIALGILNGAVGDTLVDRRSKLARSMTVRRRGADVACTTSALAGTYPHATPRIAVFVHGLCESEQAWGPIAAEPGAGRSDYGARLERDAGFTPVYLSYNTGLHVSENGKLLAELLAELADAWPRPVEEIALVGHSMGGLVARSASHHADAQGMGWVRRLRHVVCLGSPHMGAPLEKAANVAGWTLGRAAETQAFADLINGRSAGIKDMRFGACIEDDWLGFDADELLRDRCGDIGFVDGARYYFIAATVTRSTASPVGGLVGDLLVGVASASGRGRARRIGFEAENGRTLGGLHHFSLLGHPAVYEQMRAWLEAPSAAAEAVKAADR